MKFKLIAQELPGIAFFKVNVDVAKDVVQYCNVESMPSFVLYHRSVVHDRIVGVNPPKLKAAITKLNNIVGALGVENAIVRRPCYQARTGVVHIYDVVIYGRRYYRSLNYTTDNRFCLRELQPDGGGRNSPWPYWCRDGAGQPMNALDPGVSAVILREMHARGNISGGQEQFISARLLHGVVPSG